MRTPRVHEIKLRAQPEDVHAARMFFRDVAGRLDLTDEQTQAGELALSELVTNAIVHAGGAITVRARKEGRGIRLEVIDGNSEAPRMAKADPEGFDGGLPIVAAVAHEWGWDDVPDGDGKLVWLTLL
ncbi:MAG: ATP-binding protein [Acidimicrobiia bacterium]